jgi:hypothetical protein
MLKALHKVLVVSPPTATATTSVLLSRTLCDSGCCGAGCPDCPFRPPSKGGSFFVLTSGFFGGRMFSVNQTVWENLCQSTHYSTKKTFKI